MNIPLGTGNGLTSDFRLDGKLAVITGGASGIGRAIAVRFAASGSDVCIVDVNAKEAALTAESLAASGGRVLTEACDVSDQAQAKAAFTRISNQARIHILVNSAGISHIGNVETTSEPDFDRVLRVNVKGVYNCIQACVGRMMASGGGVILNIASVAGSAGLADRFAYSTSKGAVIAMTYSVARDYVAHGIRCNCISPARVHTPLVDRYLSQNYPGREKEMYDTLAKTQPIGRMGRPEEVASLALFLCSDEASFITGADYPLDGGFMNLHG